MAPTATGKTSTGSRQSRPLGAASSGGKAAAERYRSQSHRLRYGGRRDRSNRAGKNSRSRKRAPRAQRCRRDSSAQDLGAGAARCFGRTADQAVDVPAGYGSDLSGIKKLRSFGLACFTVLTRSSGPYPKDAPIGVVGHQIDQPIRSLLDVADTFFEVGQVTFFSCHLAVF